MMFIFVNNYGHWLVVTESVHRKKTRRSLRSKIELTKKGQTHVYAGEMVLYWTRDTALKSTQARARPNP